MQDSFRKFGIIIAVENYCFGIKPVKHALNDAKSMKEVFENDFGIPNDQILLLTNEKANKVAIENELSYFIHKLTKDDRFYFYYAGHGYCENGINKLTLWDTHPNNIRGTTVAIKDMLLDPLTKSKCEQTLILIDACATELLELETGRDLLSEMSLKEFEEYIQTGSFHAVYMSCSPGEKSYSSDSLMHGIWTWHLIRALRGEESAAIVRENFITSSSLKDYLCIAVPDYIRKNTEIRGTQIPWSQIASANTFEIIKLPQHHIINQGALFDLELKLDEMIFRRLIIKPISKLPGFDKKRGHFVPDYISTQVTDFIQRLVEDEIKEEINIIYDKTKRIMNLKKKEIYKSAESGGGSLDTEYFRFKIFAEQSQDEPDEAVIMRTLEIRGDYKRLPIDFDDIFPYRLDEIVIPFSGNVDFEVLVDKFEDLVDSLGGTLSENDDTGIIEFRTIQGLKITIQVYNNELVLYSREAEGCIKMIEKARKEILELSTLKSKLLS